MKWLPILLLSGCATPDSCTWCDVSYTDDECMQMALDGGCNSGEAFPDEICGQQTMGCQFFGCPANAEIACFEDPFDTD